MGYRASVLRDSLSPAGVRLTTLEVTLPRIVLAEFNTHRMLSRNSASSRAIPVEKRIAAVEADPFVPSTFGRNQKGMQAGEALTDIEAHNAQSTWTAALLDAVHHARRLASFGVHKQLANRLLEPFLWHTIVVTATEWSNFFALRCHPDAQPEIRTAAEMMREAMAQSTPNPLGYDYWHLPYVDSEEYVTLRTAGGLTEYEIALVSCGRCARVSYLTHEGRRDPAEDLALARRLLGSGHMSPFEHAATPMDPGMGVFAGNFRGWIQLRKLQRHEDDFAKALAARAEVAQ